MHYSVCGATDYGFYCTNTRCIFDLEGIAMAINNDDILRCSCGKAWAEKKELLIIKPNSNGTITEVNKKYRYVCASCGKILIEV